MKSVRLRRARMKAAALIDAYRIERPDQLEDLAWLLGAQVVEGSLRGSLARVARFRDRSRIRLSHSHVEPGQRRFSIAHEIGHVVLEHDRSATCARDGMRAADGDSLIEEEANVFAGDFLLPTKLVRKRCEVSPVDLGVVEAIAEEFHTSLVATSIRFAELTSERCAVVLSQNRKVRWVVRSETFWPEITRGDRVMPWSVAHEYFHTGAVPDDCQEIDAAAWIDGQRLRGAEVIYEHARVIPTIDGVLSLIWIPESAGSLAHRYS